jgi:molecular chaperone GrpE
MTDDNNNTEEGINEDVSSEAEATVEKQELKKLEEKEHYELDYFSKEDLVKKKEELEKDLKEFKEKAEKFQNEIKNSNSKYMHLQAEFENAQKRWNKSRQNLRIEYTASVLKNFLPLYDSFKKAIESANETEKNTLTGFYNQFMNILKSYGVEPIQVNKNDDFDYSLHEALSTVEKDDIPENRILEIIQEGFKYQKEILRYTKVIISRKPKPLKPEPEPEEKEDKEESKKPTSKEETFEDHDEKNLKEKKQKKTKKEK